VVVKCEECVEAKLVAFSCKGRGWVLALSARPEYTDGPLTGVPDEVFELSGTTAKTLSPGIRPSGLAYAAGALWVIGGAKGLMRYDGGGWTDVQGAQGAFSTLVALKSGLVLLGPDSAALRVGA